MDIVAAIVLGFAGGIVGGLLGRRRRDPLRAGAGDLPRRDPARRRGDLAARDRPRRRRSAPGASTATATCGCATACWSAPCRRSACSPASRSRTRSPSARSSSRSRPLIVLFAVRLVIRGLRPARAGFEWMTRCGSRRGVAIPLSEVELRASRSSGPGGQHANVTASRIEAVFDVEASRSLSERDRAAARVDGSGLGSPRSPRTPAARPATASSRSSACATSSPPALRVRAAPAPDAPGRAARERRLEEKRRRGAAQARPAPPRRRGLSAR